jgi:long-chain acyl-CoA synthetase
MNFAMTQDDLPLQSLYRWERERGDIVYFTQPHSGGSVRYWTWAAAAQETRRIAAHLEAQNWERGTRVAIVAKNCAWWIMADLAIWMAGHVSVPIYPSLKPQSVRRLLEHSECKACFLGATEDGRMSQLGVPAGVYRITFPTAAERGDIAWEAVVRAAEPLSGHPTRSADDLATIIYTSGTTGLPKGVMHRFGALAADAIALRESVQANTRDRFVSYLPLAHILERAGLEVSTLLVGAQVFFVESIDTFVTDLKRARPTILLSVPRLLLKFQQGVFEKVSRQKLEKRLHIPLIRHLVKKKVLGALGLDQARLVACGGAPLPVDVMMWYRNLGLDLAEGYGMTETMITHLPRQGEVKPGYVGPALEGVETQIAQNGELMVKSPMNMIGYYKDPDGSREAFDVDGFFKTGDLASMDPDGQTRIIGRLKEQFKTSKGKYVAPAPIEGRLMEHPAVEACCLMGAGLPSPFALVVLHPESREECVDSVTRRHLEQSLEVQLKEVNASLDSHERVAFLAVVEGPWSIDNGLITPTLKIRRTNLEARYLECIDAWRAQNRIVVWESIPQREAAQST